MSYDRSRVIRRFLVAKIQEQDLSENNGVPGRALQLLCLQEFCGDVQDPELIKTEKDFIVQVIRGMVTDSMLQPIKPNGQVLFRLDPYFNVKDPMNPSASQPSEDSQSTQAALEALEEDTNADGDEHENDENGESADGRVDEQAEEQLQIEEQLDAQHEDPDGEQASRIEATKHAEAYAEIRRGAAPLPKERAEERNETPSRKRRRVMEIAASDAESSMDPIRPGKYPSSPQHRRVRLGTPVSASRRRSAPAMLHSPSKHRSPGHTEQTLFKEERVDNSPQWLIDAAKTLSFKYPDDPIITDNGLVRCLTCDKPMKPTNASLSTIEQHLRGKPHKDTAALRLNKVREYSGESFFTTMPKMGFQIPPAPLAVSAHQGQPPLATIRNQYLAALENDSHTKTIQATLLQSRVVELQKLTTDKLKGIECSLKEFEQKDVERQQLVSDIIATSEEKHQEHTREVVTRLESFETKNTDHIRKLADDVAAAQRQCTLRIDDMKISLGRSEVRHQDRIDAMSERVHASETRTDQLAVKIQDFEEVVTQRDEFKQKSARLASKITDLEHSNQAKDASIRDLWDAVRPLVAKMKVQDQINDSHQETNATLHILEERLPQLAEKIKEIERINEEQKATNETIHDLESQYQLLTEGLQRRDQADDIFQKAISDQIEAHLQQIQKRITLMKDEHTDLILKTVAGEMDTQLQQTGREMATLRDELQAVKLKAAEHEKQSSKKIRYLERKDEEKQDCIQRYDSIIPTIFEDFDDLRKFVTNETDGGSDDRKSASPTKNFSSTDDVERRSANRQSVSPTKPRTSAR